MTKKGVQRQITADLIAGEYIAMEGRVIIRTDGMVYMASPEEVWHGTALSDQAQGERVKIAITNTGREEAK